MSKSPTTRIRHRFMGSTLTLEQYQLLYSYVRHGVTPNRKSLNNAGALVPRSSVHADGTSQSNTVQFSSLKRFKKIANRLMYSECDDELVFRIGSRIVLPNTRIDDVITEAHKNGESWKHLTIRRTLDKLSEKYALGSRLYGICEEHVRRVIRSCREGSCYDKFVKKLPGEDVLKNFAKQATSNQKGEAQQSCDSEAANIDRTKQVVDGSTSVTSGRLASETQTCTSEKNPTSQMSPIIQVVPITQQLWRMPLSYPIVSGVHWNPALQGMQSCIDKQLGNNMSVSADSNLNVLPSGYPVQLVHAGCQPLLPGSQGCQPLLPGRQGCQPLLPGRQGCQPLLPGRQIVLINRGRFPFPHTNTQLKPMIGIPIRSSTVTSALDLSQPNRNKTSTDRETLDDRTDKSNGTNHQTQQSTLKSDNIDNQLKGYIESNSLLGIDSTTLQEPDEITENIDGDEDNRDTANDSQEIMDASDDLIEHITHFEDMASGEDSPHQSSDSTKLLPPIPYKDIWYFYDEISGETNIYHRITKCISDMALDMRKAMVGCWVSYNKLRRKINYTQELISHQQDITKEFAELSQWYT